MPDSAAIKINGPDDAPVTLLFAHGAGAPMDSPFMGTVTAALTGYGWRVRRFEFPYMASMRNGGPRRPPDPAPRLLDCFRDQIAAEKGRMLVLAGKSMGGRMGSMLADESGAAGWLCFGYPFHPPGRPERTRTDHLENLKAPGLVLQGTRDALGNQEEVAGYKLSPSIAVHWTEDGDHHLAPRKASGRSHAQALDQAILAADAFVRGLTR